MQSDTRKVNRRPGYQRTHIPDSEKAKVREAQAEDNLCLDARDGILAAARWGVRQGLAGLVQVREREVGP